MHELSAHRPVMLQEVLHSLQIVSDGFYIDCTFGCGGHSQAILQRLGARGCLWALDRDPHAEKWAASEVFCDPRFHFHRQPFSTLPQLLDEHGKMGNVQGVLLDLGISSPQIDDPQRGFSFRHDADLDMRMDPSSGQRAAEWLNAATESEIALVLREYGEERAARRIARAIVQARIEEDIRSTKQLVQIIESVGIAKANRHGRIHPATRTFQAIRIHINRELQELRTLLGVVPALLAEGGKLLAICFHSLEDRIVKRFIRAEARGGNFPIDLPMRADAYKPTMRPIGRAHRPSTDELNANPRARSAILRVAEKVYA
ncbi:MAG: 16S rRNA (cytosine(1402)-N(4))-methyltransferase RsmH [Candidatus Eutrophobiaceae bacterium]